MTIPNRCRRRIICSFFVDGLGGRCEAADVDIFLQPESLTHAWQRFFGSMPGVMCGGIDIRLAAAADCEAHRMLDFAALQFVEADDGSRYQLMSAPSALAIAKLPKMED